MPPVDLEERISGCVDASATAKQAETSLKGCPFLQELGSRAIVAEGAVPVVLLDVGGGCESYIESFVLWRGDDAYRIQSLESILPNARDHGTTVAGAWPYAADGNTASGGTARAESDGAVVRLGLIIGQAGCGSGPFATYALLTLQQETWALKWSLPASVVGFQTSIRFFEEGINQIKVMGTSYGLMDAKSRIFNEHKLGPHRYVEWVWRREGDGYLLETERVTPSAYNTLVEFIYALRTGDSLGVSQLVTDAALVETAVAFGLAQDDGVGLFISTDRGTGIPPWFVTSEADSQQAIRIQMIESDGHWLISAIDSCTPSYDGTGGHCN